MAGKRGFKMSGGMLLEDYINSVMDFDGKEHEYELTAVNENGEELVLDITGSNAQEMEDSLIDVMRDYHDSDPVGPRILSDNIRGITRYPEKENKFEVNVGYGPERVSLSMSDTKGMSVRDRSGIPLMLENENGIVAPITKQAKGVSPNPYDAILATDQFSGVAKFVEEAGIAKPNGKEFQGQPVYTFDREELDKVIPGCMEQYARDVARNELRGVGVQHYRGYEFPEIAEEQAKEQQSQQSIPTEGYDSYF